MSGDYLWDRSGPADPVIVQLERLLRPLGQQDPPTPLRAGVATRRVPSFFAGVLTAAAAAVIALAALVWSHRLDVVPGWEVTRVTGAPAIQSRPMRDREDLKEGGWLETGTDGRVAIAVANIGQVQLEPDTRVGLLRARPGDYRLRLDRGTMHAMIWSPPGQFFVETSSSTAIDLGCAYTMTMNEHGIGLVRVTSGWVGFVWQGRESFIPAEAVSVTRPGLGPGTPHFEDTSDAFRATLDAIDTRAGSTAERSAALVRLLAEARPRDTVTLWHLLSRVEAADRDLVFDRLAAFVPPPDTVTREGIRPGRQDMLDRWWDALGLGTTNWWRVWRQDWRQNVGGR